MSETITAVREKSIMFSAPMVRAILSGAKTQTRRVVKPQPPGDYICHTNPERITRSGRGINPQQYFCDDGTGKPRAVIHSDGSGRNYDTREAISCPYGQPGDRLWVKEAWAPCIGGPCEPGNPMLYRADDRNYYDRLTWKSPLFMPRWASRITLEITAVKVERVQDISEEDARAEGVMAWSQEPGCLDSNHALNKWCRASAATALERGEPRPATATAVGAFRLLWRKINGPGSWTANPWVWCVSFRRIER